MIANRRVSYDFTISPPKSVSIVALLYDERITQSHNRAVKLAMSELEKFAASQMHKNGEHRVRKTSNLIGAAFQHDSSRELDPHLHTHCVVFNATFDRAEHRWKALEPSLMYRAQRFAENLYYHELCKDLVKYGYGIERTGRDFEIKGVSTNLIERFSKRHAQIDAAVKLEENADINIKDLREKTARTSRKRKAANSNAEQLRPAWFKQLSKNDESALESLRKPYSLIQSRTADAQQVVAWADAHLFERRSVIAEHELLASALSHSLGRDISLEALRKAIEERGYVRQSDTNNIVSPDALRRELSIVLAAEKGRDRYLPFNQNYNGTSSLSQEQQRALKQILDSRDFITLFRGRAGTGKSFTLQELNTALTNAGHVVAIVAPQRQQVLDLEKDGLSAQTLAQLLTTKQLPPRAVVIADEAGQIGGKDLHTLLQLVTAQAGRLILSGDTRQHGAVAASDALRAIEKYSGIKPAEITAIRRQDPQLGNSHGERRQIRQYRHAVKLASNGEAAESFDRLDGLGCILEMGDEERRSRLATEYIAFAERKESTLAVAQTWDEVHKVNEAVRDALKRHGSLREEQTLKAYRAVDTTEAQKRDINFYRPGQQIHFQRTYSRYLRGETYEVLGVSENKIVIAKDGRAGTISVRYSDRFAVVDPVPITIACGDRLQLKFNGRSLEGVVFSNGELVTVKSIRSDGSIIVTTPSGVQKTLSSGQRLFNHGYAVTSYASQGKTVDRVLISDSGNPAATNLNQWYVAISRGRKSAIVFTQSKSQLRANITQAGARELAMDLEPSTPQRWIQRAWKNIQRLKRQHSTQTVQNNIQGARAVSRIKP